MAQKSRAEQIARLEARLAKLRAESEGLLDKNAPGMDKLVAALDDVCKKNGCNSIVVIRSVSKFKKLGLKIEAPQRKKRVAKAVPLRQGSQGAGRLAAAA